jgi:RHS repeat-associated protein
MANNSTESIGNSFKYVGQFGVMTDAKDLFYMRARYYMPSIGRFINKDPIGLAGGLNMYSYVGGNPTNLIDPTGLKQWAPWLVELFIPPYGHYGGPLNTDSKFQKMPIDSLDELLMVHDWGWGNNQCSLFDRGTLNGIAKLPLNPYRWKRKPKNILWAIYSIPYRGYFMLYLYLVTN